MGKHDLVGILFFLGLAAAICVESYRLGPGSFSEPGPGLVPLGSGLILGIFALIVLVRTFTRKEEGGFLWRGGAGSKMIYILASMVAYAGLLNFLGFLLLNFLWMGFVCWKIGKMGWKGTLLTSLASTFLAYLLFEHYLSIRFPRGVWETGMASFWAS
jgi:hypothetical protein